MRKYTVRNSALPVALAVAAILLTLLAGGCGSAPTPTNVAEEFARQMNARQFGEIYDSLTEKSPIRKELTREDFEAQYDSIYPDGFRLDNFKVNDERILDESKAQVLWTATAVVPGGEGEPTNRTFSMVKEGDSWKIEQ